MTRPPTSANCFLAENPETQPFAAAYRVPENDEDLFPIEAAGVEEDDQMDEQEQVSRAEVLREMLDTTHDEQVRVFCPSSRSF